MAANIVAYDSQFAAQQLHLPKRVFYVDPDGMAIDSYESIPPVSLCFLAKDIFPLNKRVPIYDPGKYITLYRGVALDAVTAEKIKGTGFLSNFWRKNMARVYKDANVHPAGLRMAAKYASELRAELGTSVAEHVLPPGDPSSMFISTTKELRVAEAYSRNFWEFGKNSYIYEIRLPVRHILDPYHPDFGYHPKPADYEVLIQSYIPPEYIVNYWQISP